MNLTNNVDFVKALHDEERGAPVDSMGRALVSTAVNNMLDFGGPPKPGWLLIYPLLSIVVSNTGRGTLYGDEPPFYDVMWLDYNPTIFFA